MALHFVIVAAVGVAVLLVGLATPEPRAVGPATPGARAPDPPAPPGPTEA